MSMNNDSNTISDLSSKYFRQSARPVEFVVDSDGEYWICDAGVDRSSDLRAQGCTPHSEVHLVK